MEMAETPATETEADRVSARFRYARDFMIGCILVLAIIFSRAQIKFTPDIIDFVTGPAFGGGAAVLFWAGMIVLMGGYVAFVWAAGRHRTAYLDMYAACDPLPAGGERRRKILNILFYGLCVLVAFMVFCLLMAMLGHNVLHSLGAALLPSAPAMPH